MLTGVYKAYAQSRSGTAAVGWDSGGVESKALGLPNPLPAERFGPRVGVESSGSGEPVRFKPPRRKR